MNTNDYIKEAMEIVSALMAREGVLTDEDESQLEAWAAGTGNKLERWRAVYRRAEAENKLYKAEIARIEDMEKRTASLMVRAKLAGVEILEARKSLGQETSINGVCFLRNIKKYHTPDRLDLWPPELLIPQDPKPDKTGAKKAIKEGRDLGGGFYVEDRSSITWK